MLTGSGRMSLTVPATAIDTASAMHADFRRQLAWITLKALLALFLIPTVTFFLAQHFRQSTDARYQQEIIDGIAQSAMPVTAETTALQARIRETPPSEICFDRSARFAAYRDATCTRYSALWQFVVVEKVALWALAGSGLLVSIVLGLGALAFARHDLQALSFALGWRLLSVFAAAEVAIQGAFVVWLSFWVSAFFFDLYAAKLVGFAGIFALIAIATVVVAIFRRPGGENAVMGELLPAETAPALWLRIGELARSLRTEPPRQIVAGVDANFFVTEHPLSVSGHGIEGRTLYVSIPLLRILDQQEADAVLAHELEHFAGGDTRNSARLGPLLARYELYSLHMHGMMLTRVVAYLLDFYRVIFEIAMMRSSREREFAADRAAAKATSLRAVIHALIKISAYAAFQNKIQGTLFAQDSRHDGALDIARQIALGLQEFGRSEEFADVLRAGEVPHPFDSHPPLSERMRKVGHVVREADFAEIVSRRPETTWADAVNDAATIEERLWRAYENDFSQMHEESLAYRYLPATEEETALVLRHFPPARFALKHGREIEVNHEGIVHPHSGALIPWDNVAGLQFDEPVFRANRLVVKHSEKGMLGAKSTRISIAIARAERDRLGEALERYWIRHQAARAYLASPQSESPSGPPPLPDRDAS
jgi:Zn-dependent protease with chaperone function